MGLACVVESVRKVLVMMTTAIDVTALFLNTMLTRDGIGAQVVKSLACVDVAQQTSK